MYVHIHFTTTRKWQRKENVQISLGTHAETTAAAALQVKVSKPTVV